MHFAIFIIIDSIEWRAGAGLQFVTREGGIEAGGRAAANRGGNYCSESRNAMAERRARRGGEEWGPSINDVRIDGKGGENLPKFGDDMCEV